MPEETDTRVSPASAVPSWSHHWGRADSWHGPVKVTFTYPFFSSPAKRVHFCAISIFLCSSNQTQPPGHDNSSIHEMLFGQLGICLGRMSPSQINLFVWNVLICFLLPDWWTCGSFTYLYIFLPFILRRNTGSFRKNKVYQVHWEQRSGWGWIRPTWSVLRSRLPRMPVTEGNWGTDQWIDSLNSSEKDSIELGTEPQSFELLPRAFFTGTQCFWVWML